MSRILYLYYVINDRDMNNEEIVSMSVSEYCDLLITMAEFAGSNDPHKVNWDYTFWHGVVSEERYAEVIPALVERGFESWDN